jgi:hypothetical protein
MRSRITGLSLVSHRVSPVVDVLQADHGGDVAREHFLDLLAIIGMHLQDAADALLLALHRVVARWIAGLEHARIDTDEGELADDRGRSSA